MGTIDDTFTGGSTKDKIDLPEWKWTIKSVPDKNELVNAYAAVYPDAATGDTIIYFGADRFDTSGDANLGFWFFQDQVHAVPVPAGSFTGQHRVGDIFVLSTFTKGGDISTIQVYEWVGAMPMHRWHLESHRDGCGLHAALSAERHSVRDGQQGTRRLTVALHIERWRRECVPDRSVLRGRPEPVSTDSGLPGLLLQLPGGDPLFF